MSFLEIPCLETVRNTILGKAEKTYNDLAQTTQDNDVNIGTKCSNAFANLFKEGKDTLKGISKIKACKDIKYQIRKHPIPAVTAAAFFTLLTGIFLFCGMIAAIKKSPISLIINLVLVFIFLVLTLIFIVPMLSQGKLFAQSLKIDLNNLSKKNAFPKSWFNKTITNLETLASTFLNSLIR